MSDGSRSLLAFLAAPVLVGDPEGRAVYANPAFESAFATNVERMCGTPLASLFEGGAREAVLRAVADVCGRGREARFRVRAREKGYVALATPIDAEGSHVGVIILLSPETRSEERLFALHRDVQEPLDDLEQVLQIFLEETGGRRDGRHRDRLEAGLRAVESMRKWSRDLVSAGEGDLGDVEVLRGFDAVGMAQRIAEELEPEARGAGFSFQLMVPGGLPAASGDGERLAAALMRHLRERMAQARQGTAFTLAAKTFDSGNAPHLLLAISELPPSGEASFAFGDDSPSAALQEAVRDQGGSVAQAADPLAGVTTSIRLPIVS